MFHKPYTLIFFLIVFIIQFPLFAGETEDVSIEEAGTSAMQTKTFPSDLKISRKWGPQMPWGPMQGLLISSNGDVTAGSYFSDPRKPSEEVKKNYKLSNKELSAIYKAIVDYNFFGLKDEYDNPNVDDGTLDSWWVEADGKTKSIWVTNTHVPELSSIAEKIKGILSEKDKNIEFPIDYKD